MKSKILSGFYYLEDKELREHEDDEACQPVIMYSDKQPENLIDFSDVKQIFFSQLTELESPESIVELSVSYIKELDFSLFTKLQSLHACGLEEASIKSIVCCQELETVQFISCYEINDFYMLECLKKLETLIITNASAKYLPDVKLDNYIIAGVNNLKNKLLLASKFEIDEKCGKIMKLFTEFNSELKEIPKDVRTEIEKEKRAALAEYDLQQNDYEKLGHRIDHLEEILARVESKVDELLECNKKPTGEERKEIESDKEY